MTCANSFLSVDKAVEYILSQPDGKLLLPISLNVTDRKHSPLMRIWFGRGSGSAVVGGWSEGDAYVVYLANTIHESSLSGSVGAIRCYSTGYGDLRTSYKTPDGHKFSPRIPVASNANCALALKCLHFQQRIR